MNNKDPFTREQLVNRAFLRLARVITELCDEGPGRGDTRLLRAPLMRDEYVFAGTSVNGGGWAEHAVPLTMLWDECARMHAAHEGLETIAAFLREHLKVVHITRAEQQHLDHALGLKRSMPPGWRFGDNVFERLKFAGITFQPADIAQRSSGDVG